MSSECTPLNLFHNKKKLSADCLDLVDEVITVDV